MYTFIALAVLAAGQTSDPAPVAPCAKGLAGLECRANRVNAALSDPAVADGLRFFAKFARKKTRPAETAAAAATPSAEAPAEAPVENP